MENDEFVTNKTFGPIANGQVYTGCSVCNNKLYVVGGDCGSQTYTNHIQECDATTQLCQTLNVQLSAHLRWPRATCVNEEVL